MSEIRRITVVGAGQMGAGIAQTAAIGGFDVTLSDVAPRQLEQAVSGIEASLAKLAWKMNSTSYFMHCRTEESAWACAARRLPMLLAVSQIAATSASVIGLS